MDGGGAGVADSCLAVASGVAEPPLAGLLPFAFAEGAGASPMLEPVMMGSPLASPALLCAKMCASE